MHRFMRFGRQGQSRERKFTLLLALITTITIITTPSSLAADAEGVCTPVIGRIVSVQGTIEVQRAGAPAWDAITRLDTPVCQGDRLRARRASRAAVFIQPENLIRLDQNSELTFSHSEEETFLEFFQDVAVAPEELKQGCGAGYIITRFPRKFRIRTPHVNAAVEGTEFLVAMRCDTTELAVFEGKIRAQAVASAEEQVLSSGQVLTAGLTEPPAIRLLVKPADAVQWALYYPPLADAGITVPSADECQQLPQGGVRQICFAQRAEYFLRLGRVDEAEAEIDRALSEPQATGEALAVRAILNVVKNDKDGALSAGQEAVKTSPESSRAWLALSYAQQASFKLEEATKSVQRAADLSPDSSLVQARLAEMFMSLGRTRDAEKAARRAVDANPNEERAHTVLGFVHLAQIKIKEAKAEFLAAIERDSTAPLPRLGLGLATIRQGDLVPGREQLEIAVALDPTNSLLRSYVGKAYYEENTRERDTLAATQFGLAKQLDPNDPTPWFYEAILGQTQNRPADALHEVEESIKRNNDRAVYRSRLLLDDDSAARNSTAAAINDNLGFEKLAIQESVKALGENAGNHSAHRELAEAYSNLPRHDIARVSEALQAQIRQPLSAVPISSLLTNDSLLLIKDTGPSRLGTNEYNLLFDRDQLRLRADALAGNRDTLGNQVVVSGLQGNVAYALSQLHYETQGFVPNDAAERIIYDLFLHAQVLQNSTVQLDMKRSDISVGQTFFPFDPVFSTLQTTILEKSDSFRVSGHHTFDSGKDLIWSVAQENRARTVNFTPDNSLLTKADITSYSGELQYLNGFSQGQILIGLTHITEDNYFPIEQSDIQVRAGNVYTYGQWRPTEHDLTLHLGLAFEWFYLKNFFFSNPIERDQVSPKLGLVWSPTAGTTVRAAAFSTVRRPFIRAQTIEPTQVAGFNQFFTGFEPIFGDRDGMISQRVGVAVDQRLPGKAFAGAELTGRRLYVPSIILDRDTKWREAAAHLYFYKTIQRAPHVDPPSKWQTALSAECEYERIERPQILTGAEGIMELKTIRAPIGVRLFNTSGFTIGVASSYVEQEGVFSADVGFAIVPKNDSAWVTDLSLEHRLPRRRGSISVGVMNLFDHFIDIVETDPLNPRVAPRRLVLGKVSLLL